MDYRGVTVNFFLSRDMINAEDCIMVRPDYILSTEDPYLAVINDCYTALLLMKENVEQLGISDD
ncbi:alpha/beta hydrolase fold domain-containing protein [Vagococcus vulneris]|uniref:alpha/beta hydrolase fold domain-containing protein n=1 Tax=Vagococcus vulneris TaxID=1977869 RepID=UPI000F7E4C4F|nr:alpha/beta hydrolase fold domain-containing protein [Vagococcus vulneris]